MFKASNRLVSIFCILTLLSLSSLASTEENEAYMHPRAWGVVDENKVYRSGHPVRDQFEYVVKKYKLKSVLILTGSMPKELEQENKIAAEENMKILFLPISDKAPLTKENLFKIVEFLQESPKPLLIHCRAGADRTGLVSAIYRHLFMNASIDEAKHDMLNANWGHVGLWGLSPTIAMDKYFLKSFPGYVVELQDMLKELPVKQGAASQ